MKTLNLNRVDLMSTTNSKGVTAQKAATETRISAQIEKRRNDELRHFKKEEAKRRERELRESERFISVELLSEQKAASATVDSEAILLEINSKLSLEFARKGQDALGLFSNLSERPLSLDYRMNGRSWDEKSLKTLNKRAWEKADELVVNAFNNRFGAYSSDVREVVDLIAGCFKEAHIIDPKRGQQFVKQFIMPILLDKAEEYTLMEYLVCKRLAYLSESMVLIKRALGRSNKSTVARRRFAASDFRSATKKLATTLGDMYSELLKSALK